MESDTRRRIDTPAYEFPKVHLRLFLIWPLTSVAMALPPALVIWKHDVIGVPGDFYWAYVAFCGAVLAYLFASWEWSLWWLPAAPLVLCLTLATAQGLLNPGGPDLGEPGWSIVFFTLLYFWSALGVAAFFAMRSSFIN